MALQQKAIKSGGNSDDYRRRLRTYQAAQIAIANASKPAPVEGKGIETTTPANPVAGAAVALPQDCKKTCSTQPGA